MRSSCWPLFALADGREVLEHLSSMEDKQLRQQLKELQRKLDDVSRERDALVLGAHTPHSSL